MDVIKDMLSDWPIGTILGILCIALLILAMGLIGYLVFGAIDTATGVTESGIGTVVDKEFEASHSSIIMVGKVPIIQHHADRWTLEIQVEDKTGTIEVTQEFYDKTPIGKRIQVTYVWGGISKDLYITDIP